MQMIQGICWNKIRREKRTKSKRHTHTHKGTKGVGDKERLHGREREREGGREQQKKESKSVEQYFE